MVIGAPASFLYRNVYGPTPPVIVTVKFALDPVQIAVEPAITALVGLLIVTVAVPPKVAGTQPAASVTETRV
jgi:hypothetical protein